MNWKIWCDASKSLTTALGVLGTPKKGDTIISILYDIKKAIVDLTIAINNQQNTLSLTKTIVDGTVKLKDVSNTLESIK